MKKTMILGAALMMLCASFSVTGCGKKNDESNGTNENENKTCAYNCPSTGFGFDLPEGMKITNGYLSVYDLGDVDYDSGVMMAWPVYYDMTEENYDALTAETMGQCHAGSSFQVLCVKDVNSAEEAKEKIFALIEKMMGEVTEEERKTYGGLKMLHQENGYIWLTFMENKQEDIREECKAEYNAFYDASEQIISSMKFYTPETWKGTEAGTALSFKTVDVYGNPVDSETLFAQNKVTMVNIWATTCSPCISEMPELEEMNRELQQKGGAVVGLVADVTGADAEYLDEAKDIIKDTGVTYTNLCIWDGCEDMLEAVGTPTTYFVDSEGNLIGDPILGAHPEKYKEKIEAFLSKAV